MKILNNFPGVQHYFYSSSDNTITSDKFQRLRKVLEENGVDKEDINELTSILKSEKPNVENMQLGEKANNWLLNVFAKSINGVGKINRNLSIHSIATIIKQYYNIYDTTE